ncbi:unnamed protein product [Protopolystoma xenopodis]|uniref:Uncharacterized protein n=1 Tax=Protopolystoma xenopodis TaxID=117903 RepID=A0A448X2B0_9PLAT|nr:unnamed protein product [Protopolystoma xenopodis]
MHFFIFGGSVVYVFGEQVAHQINDITVTYLREPVIATLREVDARVNAVLFAAADGEIASRISQMPIILVPLHFDRDAQLVAAPSVLRSVVLRPFITSDFMTGTPAIPGVHIPEEVRIALFMIYLF